MADTTITADGFFSSTFITKPIAQGPNSRLWQQDPSCIFQVATATANIKGH
jgi:hypothetical protein